MKNALVYFIVSCVLVSGNLAAAGELTGSAYVEQAGGVSAHAMTMEEVMTPIRNLASNLPRMASVQGNYSFVLQNGDFNNAAVVQSGTHNAAFLAQTGYRNTAYMQQFGSGHQGFIIQNGASNFATVTQR